MTEQEPSDNPKHLSLIEKIKLLKISCRHGPRLLHCRTSGKHPEKEVWTSIMEEFSTTVREGVFRKYTEVKKANNAMCKHRRNHTKGAVPPQRRSRMVDLDMWIDRWVRIWKCRDLIIKIANAHQVIRETIGEKKLKKIFGHRIDGTELPQELGVLTFSDPLWKAIQKQIRTAERSLRSRHYSLFVSEGEDEDDSDFIDDDEQENGAAADPGIDGPPLQSIETDDQTIIPPSTPENLPSIRPIQSAPEVKSPGLSPRTQTRLEELERGFINILKANKTTTGEKISVLRLAEQSSSQQLAISPRTTPRPQGNLADNSSKPRSIDREQPYTTAMLAIKTPRPVRRQNENDDTCNSISQSSARSQRLQPGTYRTGEGVFVGWHARQIPLAGINVTPKLDFRQAVFATINTTGIINFRLRSQNMREQTIPKNFRLGKTVSVSRKDVIYRPAFNGMSYEEIQQEVARRSLVGADQSAVDVQIPAPTTSITGATGTWPWPESSGGSGDKILGGTNALLNAEQVRENPSTEVGEQSKATVSEPQDCKIDVPVSQHEAEKGPATSTRPPNRADRRDPTQIAGNGHKSSTDHSQGSITGQLSQLRAKSQRSTSKGASSVKALKKLSAETKKRRKSLAPEDILHPSLPLRKPSPRPKRPSSHKRITPRRFYGTELQEREFQLPVLSQGSLGHSKQLQYPLRTYRTSGSRYKDGIISCSTGSSDFSSPTTARQDRRDSSDDDSLPDVEELCRRITSKPNLPERSPTPQQSDAPKIPVGTRATHEDDISRMCSDPPESSHTQGHIEAWTGNSNDCTSPQLGINTDVQDLEIHTHTDVLPDSQSKKRERQGSRSKPRSKSRARSKSILTRPDATAIKPSEGLASSGGQEGNFTSDTRLVKRQKRSGSMASSVCFPTSHNGKDQSKPRLDLHSNATSTRDSVVRSTEIESSNDGTVERNSSVADEPYPPHNTLTLTVPRQLDEDGDTQKLPVATAPSMSPEVKSKHKKRKRPSQKERRRRRRQNPEQKLRHLRGKHMSDRQMPQVFGRYDRSRQDTKRTVREKTTDTVEFGRSSDGTKLDTLWRKFSRIEGIINKMKKKS
ncbi:hypothetical protein F4811DRAFT_89162 [Daldinia bambusicola]|nr:hypothetical protein F4811DRAFT_89162 [Daldinia bambusicola]